eukprot:TRINITY_DN64999_c0_g1_i1.p1 TRINITY_DN64999_c0_g1~~TRINITY_DN64999_c0_g1_i1.p1  ORF type:complete len:565 (-),score=45.08 TRINITY_DN64999_c0_g1_i1:319-2013(-)
MACHLVLVARMDGCVLELETDASEEFSLFRHRVARQVGLEGWQILLMHEGLLLPDMLGGSLVEILIDLGRCVQETIELGLHVTDALPEDVRSNTSRLLEFFKRWAPKVVDDPVTSARQGPKQSRCNLSQGKSIAKRKRAARARDVAWRKPLKRIAVPEPKHVPSKVVFGGPCVTTEAVAVAPKAQDPRLFGRRRTPKTRAPKSSVQVVAWQKPSQNHSELAMLRDAVRYGRLQLYNRAGRSVARNAIECIRGPALAPTVRLLLQAGISADETDMSSGTSLLHEACHAGRGEVAMLLLDNGAEPFSRSRGGSTPFDLAITHFRRHSHPDSVEVEAMVKAMCRMRRDPAMQQQQPASFELARRVLSCTATEIALFKAWGASLSKDEVAARSGLSPSTLELWGQDLWAGWPGAFLDLSATVKVPDSNRDKLDENFTLVRTRILGTRSPVAGRRESISPRDWDVESGADTSDWWIPSVDWDLPVLEPEKHFHMHRSPYKGSTSWAGGKSSRRPHRLPWASSNTARFSYSSRLRMQLPKCDAKLSAAFSHRQRKRQALSETHADYTFVC